MSVIDMLMLAIEIPQYFNDNKMMAESKGL